MPQCTYLGKNFTQRSSKVSVWGKKQTWSAESKAFPPNTAHRGNSIPMKMSKLMKLQIWPYLPHSNEIDLYIFPWKCGLETGREISGMSCVQLIGTGKLYQNPFRHLVWCTHKGICSSFPLWISLTYECWSYSAISKRTGTILLSGLYLPAHVLWWRSQFPR